MLLYILGPFRLCSFHVRSEKKFVYKIKYTSFNPGLALMVALTGVKQLYPNKQ